MGDCDEDMFIYIDNGGGGDIFFFLDGDTGGACSV